MVKYFPLAVMFLLMILFDSIVGNSNSLSGEDMEDLESYNDKVAKLLFFTRKRSCIRRGSSCDNRPSDCCYNSACRCNLWGTNCRCQRVGLFQKWG